ncbi:MAG: chorismate mutase [Bryobacteraceae bacterium]
MEIEDWRKKIDAIDLELVKLLNERATAARAIGRLKQQTNLPIYEPQREEVILQNVSKSNAGPLPTPDLHFIFQNVIAVMRSFQHSDSASGDRDPNERSVQSL